MSRIFLAATHQNPVNLVAPFLVVGCIKFCARFAAKRAKCKNLHREKRQPEMLKHASTIFTCPLRAIATGHLLDPLLEHFLGRCPFPSSLSPAVFTPYYVHSNHRLQVPDKNGKKTSPYWASTIPRARITFLPSPSRLMLFSRSILFSAEIAYSPASGDAKFSSLGW